VAIIVKTETPRRLLAAIKEAIDNEEIDTWSYDTDGDFTHTADQWNRRAWLRPRVNDGELVFNIVPPLARTITKVDYGIYHGRFIEMLLNHFDKSFKEVSATALPKSGDHIRGRRS